MVSAVVAFAIGCWWLQQQARLPPLAGVFVVLAAFALAWFWRNARPAGWRWAATLLVLPACAGLGFYWAAAHATLRLADALPAAAEGREIRVEGVVSSLPERTERGWRFGFTIERTLDPQWHLPAHVALSWFDTEAATGAIGSTSPVRPGERWRLTVRLKQPHGTYNPHTFDSEAWLFERGIRATGYVYGAGPRERVAATVFGPLLLVERLRMEARDRMLVVLGDRPYAGVLVALAIGDQQAIPAAQWRVFTRTGVNHLMSISGLHVTMVSGLVFALVNWAWRRSKRLPLWCAARDAATLGGLAAALGYALIAGFAVPAQRTVWMLAVVAVTLWLRVFTTPARILAAALLVVLLIDPLAVMSAGFWLSFGAVGLMMFATGDRTERTSWWRAWGRLQWALFIGLAPLMLVLFQQLSLVAPLANAFAVPAVSFVVVPLTLLGAVISFEPLLTLAHATMVPIGVALNFLAEVPAASWTQHAPPLWAVALAVAGVLWALLPRGFPSRWLVVPLVMPVLFARPPSPAEGTARVTVLDVGQGLAVVVQTRQATLAFDAGPGWSPAADSGSRIVAPYLRGEGIAHLDGLIVSHDDNDHSGGAASLLGLVGADWVATSLSADNPAVAAATRKMRCVAGQRWTWSGVDFEMLHPQPDSYTFRSIPDNARSCVLRVSTPGASVLIAADIEKESEQQLLGSGATLRSTALVVPHHGSSTSSTAEFIDAVAPKIAIFAVGYRNRFGHPRPDVVERYRAAGAEIVRTDRSGAIEMMLGDTGLTWSGWRDTRPRYWQSH